LEPAPISPLDSEALARVRRLHLRARTLTDSLLMGEHRSRRVGQAVEFADYREYAPGMDLRALDWRVLARTDRLVVKRFETETELPSTVVLDLSADMSTGHAGRGKLPDLEGSKAGFAITLAATLLTFLHRHGEPVGLELVGGDVIGGVRSFPSRGGRSHLQRLTAVLATARPSGVARLEDALLEVGRRSKRRSLVVVLTDGMEEPSAWLPSLGAIARRGSDLRLGLLYDPRELGLSVDHPALFYSPEGGATLDVDPVAARKVFDEVVLEHSEEVRAGVVRWGGRFTRLSSADPLENALRSLIIAGGGVR